MGQDDKQNDYKGHFVAAIVGVAGLFIAALALPGVYRIWGIVIGATAISTLLFVFWGWKKFAYCLIALGFGVLAFRAWVLLFWHYQQTAARGAYGMFLLVYWIGICVLLSLVDLLFWDLFLLCFDWFLLSFEALCEWGRKCKERINELLE